MVLHLYAESVTDGADRSPAMLVAQVQADFVSQVGLEQVLPVDCSLAQKVHHIARGHHTLEAYLVGRPCNRSQGSLEALNIVAR